MGSIIGNFGAAKNYKTQANVATAQGRAQQAAYDHKAGNLESEARSDTSLTAMNMERQRGNQNAATGAVRAARGASGFTDAGSGMQAEISAADAFERAISDMALSNAISDSNKRYAAETMRYQGGLAMQAAEDQATQFRRLGKSAQNAGWGELGITIAGTMIGGPAGGMLASNAASDIYSFSPGTVQSQSRNRGGGDGLANLFNTMFGEDSDQTAKGKQDGDAIFNFLFGGKKS